MHAVTRLFVYIGLYECLFMDSMHLSYHGLYTSRPRPFGLLVDLGMDGDLSREIFSWRFSSPKSGAIYVRGRICPEGKVSCNPLKACAKYLHSNLHMQTNGNTSRPGLYASIMTNTLHIEFIFADDCMPRNCMYQITTNSIYRLENPIANTIDISAKINVGPCDSINGKEKQKCCGAGTWRSAVPHFYHVNFYMVLK